MRVDLQAMNYLRFSQIPDIIKGWVNLPASKSISNRALIIRALCERPFIIQNLSDADDTVLLNSLFQSGEKELYVKNAGTVARFLLAYYAAQNGTDIILTGSDRMKGRPFKPLVDALFEIGADIEYLEEEGNLPVHIKGRTLNGGHVKILADTSSQFISAMLLIGPTLKEGLNLELTGEIVSLPYIHLTLKMMAHFGIKYRMVSKIITIPHQQYIPTTFFVESDWSSASYFFAIAALFPGSEMVFANFFEDSWQGDSMIKSIFGAFGLDVIFNDKGVLVKSNPIKINPFEYNFIDYPDLIPTFVCLCCAMNIPFSISGSRTLKHKESDRAEVLKNELNKLGYSLKLEENTIHFDGTQNTIENDKVYLNTCSDHRMAMSFAILATQNQNILIGNPEVVEKSFPGFWKEMENVGFKNEIILKEE